MKNSIPSIQARLKAIAEQEKTAYQLVLIRYFTERLMYFTVAPCHVKKSRFF